MKIKLGKIGNKLKKIDDRDNPLYFEITKKEFIQYEAELPTKIREQFSINGYLRSSRKPIIPTFSKEVFNQLERCMAFRGKPVFMKK